MFCIGMLLNIIERFLYNAKQADFNKLIQRNWRPFNDKINFQTASFLKEVLIIQQRPIIDLSTS